MDEHHPTARIGGSIPPTRLRRATSLYTREAGERRDNSLGGAAAVLHKGGWGWRDVDIPPYGIYTRKAEEAAGCGHPALREYTKEPGGGGMRASRPTGFTQGSLGKRRDEGIPPYGIYTRKAEEAAG